MNNNPNPNQPTQGPVPESTPTPNPTIESTPTPNPTIESTPTPNPTTAPTSTTPIATAPTPELAPRPPKSKKLIPIAIIVAALVIGLIIASIFLLPKIFSGSSNDDELLEESITKSDSFFIYDKSKESSALFDINGNQLTEFLFIKHDTLINGATTVRNKDEKDGIIGADGKMIVDFGVCKYLYQEGSLYSCSDEDGNDSLLDAKGKTILKSKDLDINSSIGEYLVTFVTQHDANDKKGTISVYDYKGNVMTSFPTSSNKKTESPLSNSEGNYAIAFYNDTNYIFDVSKSKLLFSFADTDAACISSINKANSSEFTMRSCGQTGTNPNQIKLWLVRDGKIAFEKTGNSSSYLHFENSALILEGNGEYLLDSDGEQVAEIAHTQYKDSSNYITESKDDPRSANLYVDGKNKQQVKCSVTTSAVSYHGIYTLSNCNGFDKGKKILMKYDGTVINKNSYKYIYPFDENGYAMVSENGNDYYLIDTNGETVSDKYSHTIYNVFATKNAYVARNSNGTESIFKVKEGVIASGDKIILSNTTASRPNICFATQKGSSYTVYNLNTGTELTTIDSKPNFDNLFFTTTKDNSTQYYSCANGKMFYNSPTY